MKFYAPHNCVRPVRLSEDTRRFAFDSLHCRYGSETLAHNAVPLDDVPAFETLSDIEKYDRMIRGRSGKPRGIRTCFCGISRTPTTRGIGNIRAFQTKGSSKTCAKRARQGHGSACAASSSRA